MKRTKYQWYAILMIFVAILSVAISPTERNIQDAKAVILAMILVYVVTRHIDQRLKEQKNHDNTSTS